MAKLHKTRNHSGNPGVGSNRYNIFKEAISKYNKALEDGYYFEAVAIVESLIADRMESRIGELTEEGVVFNTLGNLRDQLNGKKDKYSPIETNDELSNLYNKIVSDWASK